MELGTFARTSNFLKVFPKYMLLIFHVYKKVFEKNFQINNLKNGRYLIEEKQNNDHRSIFLVLTCLRLISIQKLISSRTIVLGCG